MMAGHSLIYEYSRLMSQLLQALALADNPMLTLHIQWGGL